MVLTDATLPMGLIEWPTSPRIQLFQSIICRTNLADGAHMRIMDASGILNFGTADVHHL